MCYQLVLIERGDHMDNIDQNQSPVQTGTVKWFNTIKGYGFIAPDGAGEDGDLFAHANNLMGISPDQLREGTRVKFRIAEGRKGMQAVDITLADEE